MSTSGKIFNACVLFLAMISDTESFSYRGPRMRVMTKQSQADTLRLPSNATSIRENITDNFSCEDKSYGYYADIDNECQIFHVCLPVIFSNGKNQTFRWSFICPEETIFDQGVFVCVREEDSSIKCEESEDYYSLNDNFGAKEPEEDLSETDTNNMENMEDQKNMEGDAVNRKKPQEDKKRKNERRKPKI